MAITNGTIPIYVSGSAFSERLENMVSRLCKSSPSQRAITSETACAVYVYECMCLCAPVHVYVCECMCLCVPISVYLYASFNEFMSVCLFCMDVCARVCVFLSVWHFRSCVCLGMIYAFVFVYICAYLCVARARLCVRVSMFVCLSICLSFCASMYVSGSVWQVHACTKEWSTSRDSNGRTAAPTPVCVWTA